jgi:predicted Ser/Thr protein kinase
LLKQGLSGVGAAEAAGAQATADWGAGRAALPDEAQLAATFPELKIERLIGRGGMGAVYLARQVALDRPAALKLLPAQLGRDPAFAQRFAREARAMARLNHPHIVTIYEFGERDGSFYLLMEFVDGVNLRQAIAAGQIAPAEALTIVPQICDALQYAHEEGIVHRDIKPENVLLDRRGRVKIADFGLAKLVRAAPIDVSLTASGQVLGTFHYMAPEQIERPLDVDHRADIYAVGVVFYELLTGQLPLGRFSLPSEKQGVDARVDSIVLKTLARAPDDRYQLASDLKTDVESLKQAPPVIAPRPASPAGGPKAPSAPATAAASTPLVVLPFEIKQVMAGFGSANGLLRLVDEKLQLQFEVRMFNMIRAAWNEVEIAMEDLGDARLYTGYSGDRLVLRLNDLGRASSLPGVKQGTLTLHCKAESRPLAQQLVTHIEHHLASRGALLPPASSLVDSRGLAPNWSEVRSHVAPTATMLLVMGIINLVIAALAIAIGPVCRAVLPEFDPFVDPNAATAAGIVMGVFSAAIGIMQLVTAEYMRRMEYPVLVPITGALSLLPASPLWPINVMLAIWLLKIARDSFLWAGISGQARMSGISRNDWYAPGEKGSPVAAALSSIDAEQWATWRLWATIGTLSLLVATVAAGFYVIAYSGRKTQQPPAVTAPAESPSTVAPQPTAEEESPPSTS